MFLYPVTENDFSKNAINWNQTIMLYVDVKKLFYLWLAITNMVNPGPKLLSFVLLPTRTTYQIQTIKQLFRILRFGNVRYKYFEEVPWGLRMDAECCWYVQVLVAKITDRLAKFRALKQVHDRSEPR